MSSADFTCQRLASILCEVWFLAAAFSIPVRIFILYSSHPGESGEVLHRSAKDSVTTLILLA